jgi:hypothetical protein
MRFSLAVAVVLVGFSVSGLAQQQDTFRVKRSAPAKAAKKTSAPTGKTAGSPATASASASKDLQNLERQTVKSSVPSRSAGKRTPALKPAKDKPNPPINFGGTGGGKSAGLTKQGSNPYKGRLRQKHAHQ